MGDIVPNDGLPLFKRSLIDATVPLGATTKFIVEIHSPSNLTVEWFHNDNKVEDSDRLSSALIEQEEDVICGGLYYLQIREVMSSDEGKWTCRAHNKDGGLSCCSILKIQVPEIYRAPEFIKGLRGCLWDNGTLSLQCDVLGVPTPTLRWYRNGSELVPGSALTVRAFSRESKSLMGIFACEAINCMGSKSTFSKVYAKNFADFLRQCAHMNVPNSPPPKNNIKIKTSSSNNNHDENTIKKPLCDDKSDMEDSGIASNAQ